ncbi:MAG: fluoride efflux transporter CrcB [Epsilonproteobacteria bacterium]|nr:fluoride efflux transporter CrcB [Campylobacterota bacterium]
MKFDTYLAIGIGGFIGAILRAYINGFVNSLVKHHIPFGTLSVNFLGSFILGALIGLIQAGIITNPYIKSMLTTGMMGALTTFSTFAVENFFLIQNGLIIQSAINIALNVIGTIVLAGMGFKAVEAIYG